MTPRHAQRPPEAARPDAAPRLDRPLSVSELAGRIILLLEGQIGQVTVTGEVSNVRTPASGHCYFVLKDADAAINAVCFRGVLCRQLVQVRNGMQIEARGRVTAYAQRSEYQIVIEAMREAGLGELMRRFMELKEKLKSEGLFESERKRPIPRLPRRIGIVTSSTGAALRDMLNILRRRVRGLQIFLSPAAVQGEAAPLEIVEALERLQRHNKVEVVIVGRGGGSIEDLWAFNDERVVRAIAACPIPVISAVGHETDTTLADYAADLRAPTPSAAAELVSAHHGELAEQIAGLHRRLGRAMQVHLADRRARLDRCARSWGLRKPRERLNMAGQRLDDLRQELEDSIQDALEEKTRRFAAALERLERANPQRRVEELRARLLKARSLLMALTSSRWLPELTASRQKLEQLHCRLALAASAQEKRLRWRLESARQQLEALSPARVLQRGYSIVTHGKRERIVTTPGQAREGEIVHIRSAGGPWRAVALSPEPDLFDQSES